MAPGDGIDWQGCGVNDASYVERTRAAYDVVAVDYEALLRDELDKSVWGRAVLGGFAELVTGPVVDVGCGPGRITGYLAGLGLEVSGIDLSPRMVAVAAERHPEIGFEVGSLFDIGREDDSLGGLVAWYSLVHTPPELLPRAFAEFHRVLRPGGRLAYAFKVGDGSKHPLTRGYGHDIDLDVYWYRTDVLAGLLVRAGFREALRIETAAEPHERQPQGYLVVTKED
ncbi:class I SAM-dependent DNA methyltransferase [Actinoplanes sp. NPDC051343]|uniref:class I SAM-dependent DNA methyltransferase n=1 Tax=Actinoplanes sp. NPDC051343 TaxID=3363906 RepID=UPI00378C0462